MLLLQPCFQPEILTTVVPTEVTTLVPTTIPPATTVGSIDSTTLFTKAVPSTSVGPIRGLTTPKQATTTTTTTTTTTATEQESGKNLIGGLC